MFIGEYHHSIDEKGRMSVPVKFRASLAEGAVVTRGLDRCLYLYPAKEWALLAEKLASLPIGQADTRAFARLMLAGAMDVDIDASGRILLPDYLRTYASLTKTVVVAGLYNRMEIWDEAAWASYAAQTEANGNEIAARLQGLGIQV
jgi:MraZ protein